MMLLHKQLIVGRNEEKRHILGMIDFVVHINKLSSGHRNERVLVIPITGMVGIGKATLTLAVYNSEEVQFSLKIWVSLPVEFDAIAITKKILESATNKECKLSTLDSIRRKLQKCVSTKKSFYWC